MNKDHIIFLIGRIHYKANRFLLAELKGHGIKGLAPSHGEILGSLMLRGRLQMKEIAHIIDKDKSTITALIDKLIDLNFVEKTKDRDDNRISYISLTKKGKSLISNFKDISDKLISKVYNNVSDNEKKQLVDLLTKLDKNF